MTPDGVAITDEDFDDFIQQEVRGISRARLAKARTAAAQLLLTSHKSDAYAAAHVAEALVEAEMVRSCLL